MLRNISLNTNGGYILLLEQALGEWVKRGFILLQKLHNHNLTQRSIISLFLIFMFSGIHTYSNMTNGFTNWFYVVDMDTTDIDTTDMDTDLDIIDLDITDLDTTDMDIVSTDSTQRCRSLKRPEKVS